MTVTELIALSWVTDGLRDGLLFVMQVVQTAVITRPFNLRVSQVTKLKYKQF